MRILSRNQFAMSNFSRDGYEFNEIEGTFKGTMRFAVYESFENIRYYLDVNKRQHHRVKYPLDELSFTTKIGNTEYEVSTSFDLSGKQTLLEQLKKLILS